MSVLGQEVVPFGIGLAERKIAELQADIEPLRNLTTSLSYDNAP